MSITKSTIAGNTADTNGGGIYNRGGFLTIANSTISGNQSSSGTGGIRNYLGTMMLKHSTVADNHGAVGGGIRTREGTMILFGSIIAGSTGSDDCVVEQSASIISEGYNLAGDTSCNFSETSDLNESNPLLGPLADNGGPTFSHMPQPDSPAIDRIPMGVCLLTTDQRGGARPADSACDIGSVEAGAEVKTDHYVYLPLVVSAH
jgi:hypothetical protein